MATTRTASRFLTGTPTLCARGSLLANVRQRGKNESMDTIQMHQHHLKNSHCILTSAGSKDYRCNCSSRRASDQADLGRVCSGNASTAGAVLISAVAILPTAILYSGTPTI